MKKRILAAALAVTLAAGLTPAYASGAADKFPAQKTYAGFSDVKADDWFYSTVKVCFETDLMTGKDTGFDPAGTVTVAEAAALAARMGSALTGTAIPAAPQGSDWYAGYIQYISALATAAGDEMTAVALTQPTLDATRDLLFRMLALAVPEDALAEKNQITALPDTDDQEVLRFYQAGVLTGVNDYGTFAGAGTLSRGEMAAMAARIARPELCQSFSPKKAPAEDLTYSLTGFRDSDVIFTADEYAVTLGLYLEHYRSVVLDLEALCAQQGIDFDWNNTLGDYPLSVYARRMANTEVLRTLWRDDHAVDTTTVLGAKHILVETKTEADALRAQLTAAGDTAALFDQLMAQHSTDPGSKSQPDGYTFGPGTMVEEFEDGTKALEIGQISQPIQSQFGYHIILRIAPDLASYSPPEEEAWFRTVTPVFTPNLSDSIDFPAYYERYQALQG